MVRWSLGGLCGDNPLCGLTLAHRFDSFLATWLASRARFVGVRCTSGLRVGRSIAQPLPNHPSRSPRRFYTNGLGAGSPARTRRRSSQGTGVGYICRPLGASSSRPFQTLESRRGKTETLAISYGTIASARFLGAESSLTPKRRQGTDTHGRSLLSFANALQRGRYPKYNAVRRGGQPSDPSYGLSCCPPLPLNARCDDVIRARSAT